ncbi:MAG: sensor histidine kinase [Ferruginibacter sp.]|nr:sensor histidine kinase [Ferruginibacter sp.]
MNRQKTRKLNKYTIIEIVFFIIFFFLFPIFTDIEYKLKENPCEQCDQEFINIVIHRLVFGFFRVMPFIILYRFLLHRLLLKKKYLWFLVAYIAFLFALDLYIVYVEYWTISKLSFLPGTIAGDAAKWFKAKDFFHFSIIYIINETLVFTALAYFISYAKQEERMNVIKQAKLQADLNYLKAQVQPHFFFNTLNNIYSLALQQSPQTAPLVERLSGMMRYVIYETTNQKVALQKEIDFLKNYVDVETVRYNKNITASFEVQGVHGKAGIEPLLLLPFIENMFKHGARHETGRGFIEIIICLTGNELTLQTKNSKPAVAAKQEEKGLGLENVKQRLELLYAGTYNLSIQDEGSYFEVILTLQLN